MMNKLYSGIASLVFAMSSAQHVGIGAQIFDDSEVLKVASNDKEVLICISYDLI